jgi:hypothetical protein
MYDNEEQNQREKVHEKTPGFFQSVPDLESS